MQTASRQDEDESAPVAGQDQREVQFLEKLRIIRESPEYGFYHAKGWKPSKAERDRMHLSALELVRGQLPKGIEFYISVKRSSVETLYVVEMMSNGVETEVFRSTSAAATTQWAVGFATGLFLASPWKDDAPAS